MICATPAPSLHIATGANPKTVLGRVKGDGAPRRRSRRRQQLRNPPICRS